MRLPPKWSRRLLIDPAFVVGVVLATATLPIIVIGATFVSRYVPGNWRIFRIVWFLFLYLVVEVVALILMLGLWIVSGFGWKLRSPVFVDTHYWLFGWMLRRVVASALFTFKVTIRREGGAPQTQDTRSRPILVMSRHAGPGDSMLLMDGLANANRCQPRIVMKEFLQWDPAIDVMLNRLPVSFIPVGRKAGEVVLGAIGDLAETMDTDDAFVIFPEGANYTEKRYLKSIQKLHEIGRPDLAERAEQLENTLPPRSTGVMIALESAPSNTDVFFVGHAGLETFVTPGDIWRGMPMDNEVAVKIWHVPAEKIPPAEDQEAWLYDMWAEIDAWITVRLSETGEPFDDPDEYG